MSPNGKAADCKSVDFADVGSNDLISYTLLLWNFCFYFVQQDLLDARCCFLMTQLPNSPVLDSAAFMQVLQLCLSLRFSYLFFLYLLRLPQLFG